MKNACRIFVISLKGETTWETLTWIWGSY